MVDPVRRVIARRVARISASLVLIAGAVYLARAGLATSFDCGCTLIGDRTVPLDAAYIVCVTWLLAAIVGVASWLVASRVRCHVTPRTLFAESLMVPGIGIALMLPITLHMPFVIALGGSDVFDFWVGASVLLTGFAHIVFAVACACRGYRLAVNQPAWSPRAVYALTVVTSCFPFIVLFAIPPALVAVTALPFIPLLARMETLANREREELGNAEELPRARVI